MIRFLSILFLLQFTVFVNISYAQSNIYWARQGDKILVGNHFGMNTTDVITNHFVRGIVVDTTNNVLYWAAPSINKLKSCELDGSNVQDIATVDNIIDLSIDYVNSVIYYTDLGDGKIEKVDFSGSNQLDVVTGLTNPQGIDYHANIIYWCDSSEDLIYSANSDGSNMQVLINASFPTRLDLDITNGKIYWAERNPSLIRRANLDGSSVETVMNLLGPPTDIEIDELNSKIYWTETGTQTIMRADLDGSNRELIFTTAGVSGIALHINSLLPACDHSNTFNGAYDDNWINISNWSELCVPRSIVTDSVIINENCVRGVINDSLIISDTGVLLLNNGFTLTVE